MNKFSEIFLKNAEWITVFGGIITLCGTVLINIKSKRDSDATSIIQGQLLQKSIELNNINTGGDSYPQASLFDIDRDFGIAQFSVGNLGKFSVYLTEMTVVDGDESNRIMNDPVNMTPNGLDGSKLEPFRKTYKMGELFPQTATSMPTFPFQLKDGKSFSFIFSARNGMFAQEMIVHKTKDGWISADKMTNVRTNQLIYRHVHKDFPRGMLKW